MLYVKKLRNEVSKDMGTGMTLTNNEAKNIARVIRSLEDTGFLLKGTTR